MQETEGYLFPQKTSWLFATLHSAVNCSLKHAVRVSNYKMQNVKCKIKNNGMGLTPMFLIIYEENTKILNFAFCILHLGDSSINYNLYFCTKQRESHMLKKAAEGANGNTYRRIWGNCCILTANDG